MLMQMIPSADAIGQTECDTSRAMGAHTFVTPLAFTQAATLSRAAVFRIGKLENESREPIWALLLFAGEHIGTERRARPASNPLNFQTETLRELAAPFRK